MAAILTTIHGNLLGLDAAGNLVDKNGNIIGPNVKTEGKTIYVSSVTGASNASGLSPQEAVTTITLALAAATANQGDIIVLLPKHAETITAAAGIAIAKAGVSLIGVGYGAQRPTITYTTANTATTTVTAADVYIGNVLFIGNFLSIAGAINVTAANLTLENCEFRDTDATHGFLCAVLATGAANTADGLTLLGCRRTGTSTTGGAMVNITDDLNRLTLLDNVSISAGTASAFVLSAGSKILTAANIGRNKSQTAASSGNLFISNGGATNTGLVYDNYNANLDTSGAQTFGAATGIQFFNNWSTSTSTDQGGIALVADTPLS